MSGAQELTAIAQDYVKVVWNALEWSDAPVTTKALAERLGVSAPTVSENVRRLADQGLLDHAPYGAITLTEQGRRHAVAMARRHRLIETFLVTTLGYSWDEVHDEAEVLEHACSDRMIDAIATSLGDPERDPHGDPIPRRDGSLPSLDATLLATASPGMWRVARISDADPETLRSCDRLHLKLDAVLRVIHTQRDHGGADIVLDGAGREVSLSRELANAIWLVP